MYMQTMNTEDSKPVLCPRCMDLTLCLFKGKHNTYLFLDHINGYHPIIRYKCRIEENGAFQFLEILVFVKPYIFIF